MASTGCARPRQLRGRAHAAGDRDRADASFDGLGQQRTRAAAQDLCQAQLPVRQAKLARSSRCKSGPGKG
jgi:hypothetical protein